MAHAARGLLGRPPRCFVLRRGGAPPCHSSTAPTAEPQFRTSRPHASSAAVPSTNSGRSARASGPRPTGAAASRLREAHVQRRSRPGVAPWVLGLRRVHFRASERERGALHRVTAVRGTARAMFPLAPPPWERGSCPCENRQGGLPARGEARRLRRRIEAMTVECPICFQQVTCSPDSISNRPRVTHLVNSHNDPSTSSSECRGSRWHCCTDGEVVRPMTLEEEGLVAPAPKPIVRVCKP